MKLYKHKVFVVTILLIMVVISACGSSRPATPAAVQPTVAVSAPTEDSAEPTTEPAPEPTVDPESARPDISLAKFDNPTNIDNKYFPLTPGYQAVFEGITEEAGREVPHSIIFTVTGLTKEIAGIQTVVAWIVDYSDGELVEAEVAFYAQDNDGNVWFMGEHPEVYEMGKMVEAPTWIPGIRGAEAGITMKANPEVGLPSYAQGWGPAVNWTDRGHVVALGEQICVPADCYEDVLVVEEFSQAEPNAFQVKSYAPGVGNVHVTWRGEDASQEILELIERVELDPDALAEINAAALALEAHAYEISKEVYDQTAPMK
jgi:hypothetical protein